jgi:hypothetical protein
MARLAAEREALVDYFGPVEVSIADLCFFLVGRRHSPLRYARATEGTWPRDAFDDP